MPNLNYQLVNLGSGTYGAYDPATQQARSFSSEAEAKTFFGTPTIDYSKAITPTFDVSKLLGANADRLVSFAPKAPDQTQITPNAPLALNQPDLPQPTAVDTNATFYEGQDTASTRKAVEDAYKKELERIDAEKAAAQAKVDELTAKTEGILTDEVKQQMQPFRANLEKSERTRLNVEENFRANQKLVDELDQLLTEGNAMVKRLQSQKVPGLAGIQQSPTLLNALSNVSARVGVINAVMAARNNQISVAENLIDRSLGAIQADRTDQLNYYSTLLSFYDKQRDEQGNKLINLDKQSQDFLRAQIGLLENDMERSQKTADYIKSLMVNPETAKFMADAGVTLNDSVETVQQKMAAQTELQQRQKEAKENQATFQGMSIETDFVNRQGTIIRVSDGWAFKDPEEFKKMTGMSIEAAQAGGLISDFQAPIDLKQYPASYQEYYLAVQQGYNKTYNEWLTEDANRKATRINNTSYGDLTKMQAKEAAVLLGGKLRSLVGADSFVSPQDYKDAKNAWVADGFEAVDFDNRFNNFVNPANPQDYGVKWKVTPPSAFEQWLTTQTINQ